MTMIGPVAYILVDPHMTFLRDLTVDLPLDMWIEQLRWGRVSSHQVQAIDALTAFPHPGEKMDERAITAIRNCITGREAHVSTLYAVRCAVLCAVLYAVLCVL